MDIHKILTLCDHTLLKPDARWEDIKELADEGIYYNTASICLPPCYVRKAKEYVADRIKITTVIGFPHGNQTKDTKVYEAKKAIEEGADEIDMVINIGALKSGDTDYVLDEIKEVRKASEGHILKVIIETSLLNDEEKLIMADIVSKSGADYIKTSTGFTGGGARAMDIKLIKENISDKLKIKASGGIKSIEDAEKLLEAGASRLGTSQIVKICKANDKR